MNKNTIFEKEWKKYLENYYSPETLMQGFVKECAREISFNCMKEANQKVFDDIKEYVDELSKSNKVWHMSKQEVAESILEKIERHLKPIQDSSTLKREES